MFAITSHKGFHITFANGVTVSVQFGPGNYCEHHNNPDYLSPHKADRWESRTAEVAVWNHREEWITAVVVSQALSRESEYDAVVGRLRANEVAAIIAVCAAWK